MIWLYRSLTSLIHRLLYPYGRWRAAQGSELWRGRLGLSITSPVDIWLHAASVGDVKVIGHLIQYILRLRPELRLALTTMTDMGRMTARKDLGERVQVAFFPLDAPGVIQRAMRNMQPRMVVIAETEIWPNLVAEASKSRVPVVLVNGRLSEKAFTRYQRVGKSMGRLLRTYDRMFVKSDVDRERFADLGVVSGTMQVSGDMKFDAPLVTMTSLQMAELRADLAVNDSEFLFVCGSTRPGEEHQLLTAYRRTKKDHPNLRLLLAPRHLERLPEIYARLDEQGEAWYVYDGNKPATPGDKSRGGIVVVDRMGILNDLYTVADLAFVGGTLVEIGGHNILEPVWARTPVMFGPSLGNVRDAADYIESHDYGCKVASPDGLADRLSAVIAGQRTFAVKTDTDLEGSATAAAGNYIIGRLDQNAQVPRA